MPVGIIRGRIIGMHVPRLEWFRGFRVVGSRVWGFRVYGFRAVIRDSEFPLKPW